MALITARSLCRGAQTVWNRLPARPSFINRSVQILPEGGKNFEVAQRHMHLSGKPSSAKTSRRSFSTVADLKQRNLSEFSGECIAWIVISIPAVLAGFCAYLFEEKQKKNCENSMRIALAKKTIEFFKEKGQLEKEEEFLKNILFALDPDLNLEKYKLQFAPRILFEFKLAFPLSAPQNDLEKILEDLYILYKDLGEEELLQRISQNRINSDFLEILPHHFKIKKKVFSLDSRGVPDWDLIYPDEADLFLKIASAFTWKTTVTRKEALQERCFELALKHCKEGQDQESEDRLRSVQDLLPNLRDKSGNSLFLACVEQGHGPALKVLERLQLVTYDPDKKGHKALHIAARNGHAHLISFLLNHFPMDETTSSGETPLSLAITNGQATTVQSLVKKGADRSHPIQIATEEASFSPVALCVYHGQVSCLDALLVDTTSHERKTLLAEQIDKIGNLLHLALSSHQPHIVEYLCSTYEEARALVSIPDKDGRRPIHHACMMGAIATIEFLRNQNPALLTTLDNNGYSCVHLAALEAQPAVIQLLDFWGLPLNEGDVRPIDLLKGKEDPAAKQCRALLINLPKMAKEDKKRPPNFTLLPPENLVFQAGDLFRALSIVGALQALDKKGSLKNVERVAGSSMGAVLAALVSIGYSLQELSTLLHETDFRAFLDYPQAVKNVKIVVREPNLNIATTPFSLITTTTNYLSHLIGGIDGFSLSYDKEGNLTVITETKQQAERLLRSKLFPEMTPILESPVSHAPLQNALSDYWQKRNTSTPATETALQIEKQLRKSTKLCKGEVFREWIEKKISEKTGTSNCTFEELDALRKKDPKKFKDLDVYIARLSAGPSSEVIRLNGQNPQYGRVVVSDALRAAIASLIFEPHVLYYKDEDLIRYPRPDLGKYIDASSLARLPVDAYDANQYTLSQRNTWGGSINRRTLGFSCTASKDDKLTEQPKDFKDLLALAVLTLEDAQALLNKEVGYTKDRVIYIPLPTGLIKSSLSKGQKQVLVQTGAKEVEQLLKDT